jgi:hypothetical protein
VSRKIHERRFCCTLGSRHVRRHGKRAAACPLLRPPSLRRATPPRWWRRCAARVLRRASGSSSEWMQASPASMAAAGACRGASKANAHLPPSSDAHAARLAPRDRRCARAGHPAGVRRAALDGFRALRAHSSSRSRCALSVSLRMGFRLGYRRRKPRSWEPRQSQSRRANGGGGR